MKGKDISFDGDNDHIVVEKIDEQLIVVIKDIEVCIDHLGDTLKITVSDANNGEDIEENLYNFGIEEKV